MNIVERAIYDVVKHNPYIKNIVRDVYQRLFCILPFPEVKTDFKINVRPGHFFGFHDKSPWSSGDNYLLSHQYSIKNRKISPSDEVQIGIFQGTNFEEFIPLQKTNAFNWQQGSMLQWIGQSNNFIYNSYDGTKHVGNIYNLSSGRKGIVEYPVAAVSPDGTYLLSYSFERMSKYAPGYGYENGFDPEIQVKAPKNHGIFLINLNNNKAKMLFSVSDIVSVMPSENMKNAYHYLTHCLFNPASERFVFYHRWIIDGNFVFTRMFSSNIDGSDLFLFPTDMMVSHISWKNNIEILAYSRVKGMDGYFLFKDKVGTYTRIGEDFFSSDGHPSFSPDGNCFITDTYPDRFRYCYLYLYNLDETKHTNIGKFRQPIQFKEELRCDLHPRWNRKGNVICFDSAHQGQRSLCTIQLY